MNKTVDTRICEVTVYNDQAQVTRRGVVQLTGEEHELVIASTAGDSPERVGSGVW
jgi:hypothetical protein